MFNSHSLIRTIYLYLFSLVGLFIVVFGSIGLIKLALTTWVFPDADTYSYDISRPFLASQVSEEDLVLSLETCEETCDLTDEDEETLSQWLEDYRAWKEKGDSSEKQISSMRQRQLSENLSMIIIGLPLYLYHWTIIKKDVRKKKKEKE